MKRNKEWHPLLQLDSEDGSVKLQYDKISNQVTLIGSESAQSDLEETIAPNLEKQILRMLTKGKYSLPFLYESEKEVSNLWKKVVQVVYPGKLCLKEPSSFFRMYR